MEQGQNVMQPLYIDCNINYDLDRSLFIGDPEEKALILPWQEKSLDSGFISPWTEQLTREQLELANIIDSIEIEGNTYSDVDLTELLLTDSEATSSDLALSGSGIDSSSVPDGDIQQADALDVDKILLCHASKREAWTSCNCCDCQLLRLCLKDNCWSDSETENVLLQY